jgi:hypothetical protein
LSDKDFKVKNKLQVKGITSAGPVVSDASGNLDSTAYIATQYGGTGTSTSPNAGQILYSSGGTTYSPTTLSSLDVKGATYSADAPASPFVGQVWIESDSSSDSFDPNIIRRKSFTATAGQTVFTTDYVFIDGYEQVYFNGMLLLRNTDYTTNGASYTVTLTSAAAVNDIVEIVAITNLNSINTATTTTNTFTGTQTIQGTSASSFGVDISQTNTSSLMRVGFDDSSGLAQIGNWSNNSLRFLTNASEKMRIDASGNIGIGTSSPTSKFHVVASAMSPLSIGMDNYYYATYSGNQNSSIIGVSFSAKNSSGSLTPGAYIALDNSGAVPNLNIQAAGTSNGQIIFGQNNGSGGLLEKMRIDSSGNVGIGTSSPYYKLSVNGTLNAYSGVAGLGRIFLGDPGDPNGYIGIYRSSLGPANYNTAGNGLNFASIDGYVFSTATPPNYIYGVQTERMRIASDGTLSLQYVDASAPRLISTSNNNNKLIVFEGYAGGLWNFWGGHGGGSYFGISENASTTPVFAITGSTNYVLIGYTSSQGAYKLQVNSQIFATSSSIATSDGRYKENVDTITGGLDIIDSLRPVSFTWKDHPVHNFVEGKTVGFIAQEVKESLSQYDWVDNIIKTNTSDAILDEDGNEVTPAEEFLGIAESNIIPLLVAAVKELKTRVETLEAK